MSTLAANGVCQFTESDIIDNGSGHERVNAYLSQLIRREPAWMKAGRQQTASGYGAKLNSGLMIHFEGKERRIYVTCYGNAGTSWFTYRGRKIIVS